MVSAIEIQGLTKSFGNITAVKDVTLDVDRGEIFGFLGPNGAGKSTTVKLATSLLSSDRGTVVIEGHDVQEEPVKVREITGLLPEDGADTHYDRLSAEGNLQYFGQLYGIPKKVLQPRIDRLLEFLELDDRRDDNPATFSTGLKQKLSLARTLIHEPPVVFLDEPTSSLDPIMSAKIREFIHTMRKNQNTTFFICTHLLTEAESMCDRVAFISHGRLIEMGKPQELRRKFWIDRTFEAEILQKPSAGLSIVESTDLAKKVWVDNERVVFVLADAEKKNPQIVRAMIEAGLDLVELRERIPSLEDVYFKVIGGN